MFIYCVCILFSLHFFCAKMYSLVNNYINIICIINAKLYKRCRGFHSQCELYNTIHIYERLQMNWVNLFSYMTYLHKGWKQNQNIVSIHQSVHIIILLYMLLLLYYIVYQCTIFHVWDTNYSIEHNSLFYEHVSTYW